MPHYWPQKGDENSDLLPRRAYGILAHWPWKSKGVKNSTANYLHEHVQGRYKWPKKALIAHLMELCQNAKCTMHFLNEAQPKVGLTILAPWNIIDALMLHIRPSHLCWNPCSWFLWGIEASRELPSLHEVSPDLFIFNVQITPYFSRQLVLIMC